MNYGYVKVAASVPRVRVADCKFNVRDGLHLVGQVFAGMSGGAENHNFFTACMPLLAVCMYFIRQGMGAK